MEKDSQKKINLNRIDLVDFKKRGITNEKISIMLGISIETVNQIIWRQEQYKEYSGVF